MGSWLECENDTNHKNKYKRYEFVKSLAERKPLSCGVCGGKLTYKTKQVWPNSDNYEANFVLEEAYKIDDEYDKYAPFLLKLKNPDGEYTYWLQYWVKTKRKGSTEETWKYGQYAPLLDKAQMENLAKLLQL